MSFTWCIVHMPRLLLPTHLQHPYKPSTLLAVNQLFQNDLSPIHVKNARATSVALQVAALRDAVKRALTVQQECEAHKNALSTVGRQISAGPAGLERTQFDQVLEETRQEEIGASRCAPILLP